MKNINKIGQREQPQNGADWSNEMRVYHPEFERMAGELKTWIARQELTPDQKQAAQALLNWLDMCAHNKHIPAPVLLSVQERVANFECTMIA